MPDPQQEERVWYISHHGLVLHAPRVPWGVKTTCKLCWLIVLTTRCIGYGPSFLASCPAPSNAKSDKGSGQTCIGAVRVAPALYSARQSDSRTKSHDHVLRKECNKFPSVSGYFRSAVQCEQRTWTSSVL